MCFEGFPHFHKTCFTTNLTASEAPSVKTCEALKPDGLVYDHVFPAINLFVFVYMKAKFLYV